MNKKTKICLNAMVGNEAPTIRRMLESAAPHIDFWVIQCNGKEDNTKTIIEEFFKEKNIPGFTYEIDWNFPGWNRDHTLQTCLKSDHGCDWILRMDADELLQVDDDFDWSILDDTSIQSYNIVAQAGAMRYFRTWFWNAKLPWFFQHDKRHETIHLPEIGEGFQRINMPYSFRHVVINDGVTWAAPRKFLRDALELEIDKIVGDKVLEDSYHLWYIGKSYADCYRKSDDFPFGRKHSIEYARRALFYFDRYFEVRHNWHLYSKNEELGMDEMAYFALILMGQMYDFMEDFDKCELCFDRASLFCPFRNEHYVYFMEILDRRQLPDLILPMLEFCLAPERTNPFPNRSSFLIEDRAYHDTSDYLLHWKNKLLGSKEKKIIDSSSFVFDFN